MILASYVANPLISALSDFKPTIHYLLQIINLLNKSKFSYKRQNSQLRNVNALLITITSSLIVVLYTLKTIIAISPLRKSVSAKTLSQYATRMPLQLVAKELYDRTSLLRTNTLLSAREAHILHQSVNRKLRITCLQQHKLQNQLKRM